MICSTLRKKLKTIIPQWDAHVEECIRIALDVTTVLHRFLQSPAADLLTAIIPGNLDDLLRQQLLVALQYAIDALGMSASCVTAPTLNDKVQCMAKYLLTLSVDKRDALLLKLASIITARLDGNRKKQNVYDLLTQACYSAEKAA